MTRRQQQQNSSGEGPVRASDVEAKPVEWLWGKRIPKGDITVVAGRPDMGKGLFAAHVAADVSKRGGKVIYSAIEDDMGRMTRPRLEAAGANLDNIMLWSFSLPADMEALEAQVRDFGASLVVMDPLAAHLQGVSRYSDSIRLVTNPITKMARSTKAAFLVVEHAIKRISEQADPLTAISGGGSGMVAASRAAFLFGVDPEDDDYRMLCSVKSNYGEKPKAIQYETDLEDIRFDTEVTEIAALLKVQEMDFHASKLLRVPAGKTGRKPEKRADAAEWLMMYLHAAAKPVKAGEVIEDAKQHGISRKTVTRAATEHGIVRTPPGGGPGCTWSLNADLKAALDQGGE